MTFNTLKEKLPFLDSFVTVAPISLENEKIYHDARSAAFFAMGRTMKVIIPGLSEPPVRTLRATIPENESHIFR